jgi:hypothetical protein
MSTEYSNYTLFASLAEAARSIEVGDLRSFQASVYVYDWPEKPYWFYVKRNDAEAFIVERQYAPGRRIDLTEYRRPMASKSEAA